MPEGSEHGDGEVQPDAPALDPRIELEARIADLKASIGTVSALIDGEPGDTSACSPRIAYGWTCRVR